MREIGTIGSTVRAQRKALGLRQDQLAAACGVGVRFVVELERGKPTVQMRKVLDVLSALGCHVQIRTPDGIIPIKQSGTEPMTEEEIESRCSDF